MNKDVIQQNVANSLYDDIGSGDLCAQLLPVDRFIQARVISREAGVLCGVPWAEAVYAQLDNQVILDWQCHDGETFEEGQTIVVIQGLARSVLTGERCLLNWLQTLSGTATTVAQYVKALQGSNITLLDTRKTVPGLRYAQKYAVRCAGGSNHRMGLYDAFLIKENHISSCGSIAAAVARARSVNADVKLEVEVENLAELQQALDAGVEFILLDNFSQAQLVEAVACNHRRAKLEVSGNVGLKNIAKLATIGIDAISVGGLTKHVRAIDFSMRVMDEH